MMYSRLTGNGGTFVEFYQYPISSKILIKKIKDSRHSGDSSISVGKEFAGYLHLILFDKEHSKYFHTWLSTDTINSNSEIIFYGLSKGKNEDSAERINRDFGLIARFYYINRFKKMY